jgi:integral membrane protein
MLKFFKIIAILEGISYLVLFANMLIVKPIDFDLYGILKWPIGAAHGALFVAYCVLAVLLKYSLKWTYGKLAIILAASLLPFATFWVEKKYL